MYWFEQLFPFGWVAIDNISHGPCLSLSSQSLLSLFLFFYFLFHVSLIFTFLLSLGREILIFILRSIIFTFCRNLGLHCNFPLNFVSFPWFCSKEFEACLRDGEQWSLFFSIEGKLIIRVMYNIDFVYSKCKMYTTMSNDIVKG